LRQAPEALQREQLEIVQLFFAHEIIDVLIVVGVYPTIQEEHVEFIHEAQLLTEQRLLHWGSPVVSDNGRTINNTRI
jgi:hypothetical protein